MTEKRRHPRWSGSEHTYVCWTDAQGDYRQEKAAVGDVSSRGLSVALKVRIECRTQVSLRSSMGGVTTSACVRHVRQKGLRYIAGLELPMPESYRHG